MRLELPRARGWSAYGSYTLSKVEQEGPINGGLFLEDEIGEIGPGTTFTPDHDQRHVASAGVTFQPGNRGLVAALTARYESGTPVEVDDDEPDDREELDERPGADLVDFERGRVKPRFVVDLAVSQRLLRGIARRPHRARQRAQPDQRRLRAQLRQSVQRHPLRRAADVPRRPAARPALRPGVTSRRRRRTDATAPTASPPTPLIYAPNRTV